MSTNFEESKYFMMRQSMMDLFIILGISVLFILPLSFVAGVAGNVLFQDALPASFSANAALLISGIAIVILSGAEQHAGTELND